MADGDGIRRTRERWPSAATAALFCAAAVFAVLDGTYLLALCWSSLAAGNGLLAAGPDERGGPSSAFVWALIGTAVVSFVAHAAL